jgi:hypothetical protein
MAGWRHHSQAEVLGLRASLANLTLLLLMQRLLGTAFLIGGFLLEHVREHVGACRGGGRRRFCGPPCAAHAAIKRSERAGARAETVGSQAPGAPGPIVDTPTACRQDFATTNLVIGTATAPGDTRLVRRPCRPIEAHLGEEEGDREGLSPRHWREGDASAPGALRAERNGGLVALGLPMGGRGWGDRRLVGIDQGIEGTEDARNVLSAGRPGLLGTGREFKRVGEGEDRCGAVIPLQGFGPGVGTGCDARVPIRGEGRRGALPRDDSTEHAQARHPGTITTDMVQGERPLIQGLVHMLPMLHRHPDPMLPVTEETAEPAQVFRRTERWRPSARRMQLLEPSPVDARRFRAPRHMLDVSRIAEGDRKASGLQNLEEWEPGYPGGFPHACRNPTGRSPVGEPMHVAGKGAKFLDRLSIAVCGDADPRCLRPHIAAGGMGMDDRHMLRSWCVLLAFFSPMFLQSRAERGEHGKTGLLLSKDTIGGGARRAASLFHLDGASAQRWRNANNALGAPREAQNLGIGRKPMKWVVGTQWVRASMAQVPPEQSLASRSGANPRASRQGGVWSRGERAGRPRHGAPKRV